MANKSGNKEFRTCKMQIEHSGLTFASFFVRTIMFSWFFSYVYNGKFWPTKDVSYFAIYRRFICKSSKMIIFLTWELKMENASINELYFKEHSAGLVFWSNFFVFFCGCRGFCHRTELELFLFLFQTIKAICRNIKWLTEETLTG